MKDKNKIPLDVLRNKLQTQKKYRKPNQAIHTLLLCWIQHPKYPSPCRETIRRRILRDGFGWLKEEELPSFEAYIGYPLR